MILNMIHKIEEKERNIIENLRLKENNKRKYMIYKMKIYINEKRKKRKNIENYEYDSECDKKSMKKEINVNI